MDNDVKIPHPFKNDHHVPGAPMLTGPETGKHHAELRAALAEHVVGHRITRIEFTREQDPASSQELRLDVDNIDVTICLDNNMAYCARFVVASFATVSRGEALAHIKEGEEDYVQPQK